MKSINLYTLLFRFFVSWFVFIKIDKIKAST